MHQLGVKNTPHHQHRHATTNYVTKWVGFNWKTRHFPPLEFLRGYWLKRRQKCPPEVFPQDKTAHSENSFVRSYAKWWIQNVYLDKSLRSVEARSRGCEVVSKQQQTIGGGFAQVLKSGGGFAQVLNLQVLNFKNAGNDILRFYVTTLKTLQLSISNFTYIQGHKLLSSFVLSGRL